MADTTGFDAIPDRYKTQDGKEVIDCIREYLDSIHPQAFYHFCMGTNMKYQLRAGKKGPAENDLEKARFYWQMAGFIKGWCEDPRTYRKDNGTQS